MDQNEIENQKRVTFFRTYLLYHHKKDIFSNILLDEVAQTEIFGRDKKGTNIN